MYTQPDTSHTYAMQAEILVDILSTQKSQFINGITEYALIEILKKPPYQLFDEDALRDPLMLFRTHFILFHALYQLRQYWIEQNEGVLEIHALGIKLNLFNERHLAQSNDDLGVTTLENPDPLATYYLDWGNFEEADRDTVDNLLNAFWERMLKGDTVSYTQGDIEKAHALLGLSLNQPVTLLQLKRVYKRSLQSAHPDKGGTQQGAQAVIHAYQTLSRYYSFK
ncbi:DNA-J related domain-containing protein [Alteromonas sp. PRIM-21]|uniref:DNA-J related domain-containing protein n=1 Tax=Alteromonas sp. PRIM-21 TaxID=1454978 RepID=UPI0022B9B468|nr:DNA-J related domain-containing protein [Alteromonas sp. PRIM-21]